MDQRAPGAPLPGRDAAPAPAQKEKNASLAFLLAHPGLADQGRESELSQEIPGLAGQIKAGWDGGWRPPAAVLVLLAAILAAGFFAAAAWRTGGIVFIPRHEIPLPWQKPKTRVPGSASIPDEASASRGQAGATLRSGEPGQRTGLQPRPAQPQ